MNILEFIGLRNVTNKLLFPWMREDATKPSIDDAQENKIHSTFDVMQLTPQVQTPQEESISKIGRNQETVGNHPLLLRPDHLGKTANIDQNLFDGVKSGDLRHVQKLLAQGAKADVPMGKDAETALHHAVNDPLILAALLATHPNPNVRTALNFTPLHEVLRVESDLNSKMRCIQLLLAAKASVNPVAGSLHQTPLLLAMESGSIEILRCLIHGGADPLIRNRDGETLLHYAKTPEQVDVLLDAGLQIEARSPNGSTPFLSVWTSLKAKKRLVERGADPAARNKKGQTILHIRPTLYGQFKLPFNLNVTDNEGLTPLMKCDDSYQAENTRFLTAKGANVHQRAPDGKTALHFAKNAEQVDALLSAGAGREVLDKEGNTPFMLMVSKATVPFANYLLKRGFNIHAVNLNGLTALHLMAQNRNKLAMGAGLLVKAGLKQVQDNKGRLPLHIAAVNAYPDDLRALVALDPESVNKKDEEGKTALHLIGTGQKKSKRNGITILYEDLEACVRILLQFKADIHARDKGGRTPLHVLAQLEDINPLQQLLRQEVLPEDRESAAEFVKANGRSLSAYRALRPATPLSLSLLEEFIGHANHTSPLTEPGYNILQKATGDEVRMLAKQILAEPQLSGALLRKIFRLRTFSLDYWASRSKADWVPFVKDGLKAMGPLTKSQSPLLSDIRQALRDVSSEPIHSVSARTLLEGFTSSQIECFGRTLVIRKKDQSLLCIKLQDKKENLRDLAAEPVILRVLRHHKDSLKLRSDLPEPTGIFKISDLFTAIGEGHIEGLDALKNRVGADPDKEYYAYVYQAPENYFQYLNNTDIDDDKFKNAWINVLHDLAVLRRHHIGFSVVGLFHDGLGTPVNHQRRYFPLHSLLKEDHSPEGVVDGWIKTQEFPNVALNGLRDFGDIIIYDDLDDVNNRVRASFLTSGNRAENVSKEFMVANLRVEPLLAFELMLAYRKLKRYQDDPGQALSLNSIEDVKQSLQDAAIANMMYETGATEEQVRALLFRVVDWNVYAHQLLFWSNSKLYVPAMKRGELPQEILPAETIQLMDAEYLKFHSENLSENLGFADVPHNGPDLGKNNGEYPVKEGVKSRYLAAFIAGANQMPADLQPVTA